MIAPIRATALARRSTTDEPILRDAAPARTFEAADVNAARQGDDVHDDDAGAEGARLRVQARSMLAAAPGGRS
jgi:hypothetical protein